MQGRGDPRAQSFLEFSTHYTLESLQEFCDTFYPTPFVPPSISRVRDHIQLATAARAAGFLIDALGGEDECKKLLGRVNWWQLREGEAEGEWFAAKGDLKRAGPHSASTSGASAWDELETILYFTGGGKRIIYVLYIGMIC